MFGCYFAIWIDFHSIVTAADTALPAMTKPLFSLWVNGPFGGHRWRSVTPKRL